MKSHLKNYIIISLFAFILIATSVLFKATMKEDLLLYYLLISIKNNILLSVATLLSFLGSIKGLIVVSFFLVFIFVLFKFAKNTKHNFKFEFKHN